MRVPIATALVLAAVGVVSGCGHREAEAPSALPPSGAAYRALTDGQRLGVAASCRDRAAARADGVAAEQIGRADPRALRDQLDLAFTIIRNQRRPVAKVCEETLPFVTPGLSLRFEGAKDSGDAFTFETNSYEPLTIRGAASPARAGTVTVRREHGSTKTYRGRIGKDGRLVLPTLRLRKAASNTFIVSGDAPPSAPRRAYFSAICLDCLAGGPPPSSAQ